MKNNELQEMQEMAQFVFDNGEMLERNAFMLGEQYKISYVFKLDGYKYYITSTDGEWTYFFRGGEIL